MCTRGASRGTLSSRVQGSFLKWTCTTRRRASRLQFRWRVSAWLTVQDLQHQLQSILTAAITQPNTIGLLTTQHRDVWAAAHAELEKVCIACRAVRRLTGQVPTNKASLDAINRAILVLCLDDATPKTHTDVVELTVHGGGSAVSSANRWFDKMQLIIAANGKVPRDVSA